MEDEIVSHVKFDSTSDLDERSRLLPAGNVNTELLYPPGSLKRSKSEESSVLSDEDLDMDYTFWLMKKRQYERILTGTLPRPKSGGSSAFWITLYLAFYGCYLFLQIWYYKREKEDGYKLEFILMGFMSISAGIISSRFGWLFCVTIFYIYAYFWAFFIEDLYYKPDKYLPIGGGVVGIILLTAFFFYIYPYMLRCWIVCSGSVVPKLSASKDEEGSYRVELEQTGFLSSPKIQCVYQGPLFNGKPEGRGTWIDTSSSGEFLQGLWHDGVPIGPFESMESGHKSLLVNLRIYFATNAGGEFWTERIGLHYGVAAVECCVSGNFFKGYPKVDFIMESTKCVCHKKCTCVSEMSTTHAYRHIDDEKELKSVLVSVDKNQLVVTGYKSKRMKANELHISLEKKGKTSRLVLDEDWMSSYQTEGLLFIHGYDHNLKDSLKRFGQFLGLGHFPPNIKPFVFNWPASTNPLFYWCAHNVASDNDVHRDLRKFIQAMKQSGIKHLHIMCHSMGSRFFLRSFNTIRDVFSLRLTSPHNSFHEDMCLLPHKVASEDSSNPNSPTSSRTEDSFHTKFINLDGIELMNLVFLSPDYELETFKNDYYDLQHYCHRITIYADHRDAAIRLAFKMTSKLNLGNNITPLTDNRGKFLDIDLIDTSDLDQNTNDSFHSFFNINRLMVDDLYDLVVTGKRAAERNSRLKRWGQVYRFTILPSSVVMV